ncbi:amino acid adenylation domain-containing protein [Amycolatopsis sp. NPDC051758]|uniref:amino acid adenylation domain-containing protein n=1 Tax=Amycolatopsis sp. NPDC051758 TaxID=3363935 RepID=UPI0037BA54A4
MSAEPELVHQAIADQARADPTATAVVHGRARLTFAELDAGANRLAHLLRRRGVRPESRVGVCLPAGPDLIVALLAVLKAGGAYVPVDPATPPERLRWMLDDSGAALVLTRQSSAARTGRAGPEVITLDTARHDLADLPATDPLSEVDSQNLAYVIYTSGSTGRPKGVQITHGALARYLGTAVADYCASGSGGAPLLSTVSCDLMVPVLYATLLSGQPVHVLDEDTDPGRLGAALVAAGPFDFIKLTPSQLVLLTRQLTTGQISGLAATVVVGGEALPGATARHWAEHLGGRLINSYGPTEATVGTTAHSVTGTVRRETVPIGLPVGGATVHVLDDRGRPVPAGVAGELHIGGDRLARGYGGRPDLTAERFVPDPFGPPGARLYRTGDLAVVLPDGTIDFLGRIDGQVKIRGYRVETGEVEHALIRLPQVAAAVVTPYEPEPGDRRLVAYVVPEKPGLDVSTLRAELGRTLPGHMVPGIVITLDALPLAATGKVDRTALPDPAGFRPAEGTVVTGEATDLQRAICEIWARALFVERIDVHDDFFRLGGDSLTAVRVMFELQQERGLDVAVHTLYAAPTAAELAATIDSMAARAPAVAPIVRRRQDVGSEAGR